MTMCRVHRALPVAFVATISLAAASGLAQPEAKPVPTPPPPTPGVLWLETASWDSILVSPKDARLKQAMKLFPARIADLHKELPPEAQHELPTAAFDLAAALLANPVRAAVAYDPENPAGGFFGGGLLLSFLHGEKTSAESTAGYVQTLSGLSPFKPKASKAFSGMSDYLLPFGMVRSGPRQTAAGWAYELHVGTLGDPDALLAGLADVSEAGVKAYFKSRFDMAPLSPLLDFVEVMAGEEPEAAAMIAMARESGVFGPNGVKATFVAGYTDDRAVTVLRAKGLSQHVATLGMSTKPVTSAMMKVIPADAHFGTIATFDTSVYRQQIDTLITSNEEAAEGFGRFREMTGVDLNADVLGSIGGSGAFYHADSTGGGGVMSVVVALGVTDKARLGGALDKLAAKANEFLANPETARGYAQLRRWTDDSAPGCAFHSISFAGLPFPLEITYALAGDWLLASLTPQGALVAARQAVGKGDGGIASNPRIASALPKGEYVSFSFNDPTKTVREGYAVTSMVGAAVANLVRSRAGATGTPREVGMVVPPLGDLLDGARAIVKWTAWESGDLVQRSESDRSMLVQMSAKVGMFMPYVPLLSLGGAGAMIGAAQEQMRAFPPMGGQHDHDHDHDEPMDDEESDEPMGE